MLAIEAAAHTHPWSKQQLTDSLNDTNTSVTLVLLNNDIVGYVYCLSAVEQADILNICITPKHQGQGLGRQLLGYLCEQLRQQGVEQLFLEVRESNHTAIRF